MGNQVFVSYTGEGGWEVRGAKGKLCYLVCVLICVRVCDSREIIVLVLYSLSTFSSRCR